MNLVLAGLAAQLRLGMHAVPLPAYIPELNPLLRVWLHRRERCLSHPVLRDHGAVLDAACPAWNALAAEAGRLASLTSYPYLLGSELS